MLDLTLPFDVVDIELRTMMQYGKHSLADFLVYIHNLTLYMPIQPKILERLQNGSRVIMTIHREFGKSTMAEDLAVRELSFNKNAFVVFFCKSDESAENRVGAVKGFFEMEKLPNGKENPFIQLRPSRKEGKQDRKYKWTNSDFILNNGNRCLGGGAGKAILGVKEQDLRPTLIIIDDPVDPDKPSDDEKMIAWLRQTISPLGGPMTRIIIIGTPRRYTDVIMTYLREPGVYQPLYYPALYEDGSIMCDDYWLRRGSCCVDFLNPEFKCQLLEGQELIAMHVKQKIKEYGSAAWSSEFLLKPIDDSTSLFPMRILNKCKMDGVNYTRKSFLQNRRKAYEANEKYKKTGVMPKRIPCVMGVDLAPSEKPDGDWNTIFVESIEEGKPRELLDGIKVRGLPMKEFKQILVDVYRLYRAELVMVESNGWQIHFIDDAAKYEAIMPIMGHSTHTEKHSTKIGIPSMKTSFENEQFLVPYPIEIDDMPEDEKQEIHEETVAFVDLFFHQLHGFNYDKGQVHSVTAHDDLPMGHWMATLAAREVIDNSTIIYDGISFSDLEKNE